MSSNTLLVYNSHNLSWLHSLFDLAETINVNEALLFLCGELWIWKKKKPLKIHLVTSVVLTNLMQQLNALPLMMHKNIPVLTQYKLVVPTPYILKKKVKKIFWIRYRTFHIFFLAGVRSLWEELKVKDCVMKNIEKENWNLYFIQYSRIRQPSVFF